MGQFTIGIDLGTTYTCVGAWRNGKPEIIPNEQGNRITPSCISFTEDERLVGDGAKNQAAINPSNTIFDAKRLIGRRFEDTAVQSDMSLWPFKVVASEADGKPLITVKYKGEEKLFAPEEISAMVLSKMKEISETYLGCEVRKAVVTVPAYFNDSQRRSTKDAGRIAGLDVIRIINEPTAAAFTYGLHMHDNDVKYKKTVLIFDLGGGTFDVSLLQIDGDIIEVKATAGDTHLGGEDFDNNMVLKLSDEFMRKHGKDITKDARAIRRLKSECERAKRHLSLSPVVEINLECLHEGIDFCTQFSRVKFEDLNRDMFNQCITIIENCLKDAQVDKGNLDDIVLIGGSARIPKIQEMVREFFDGKELCNSLHMDEAVAIGAAIHANQIVGEGSLVPRMVLKDVTPISLGLRQSTGMMVVVVPKNTPIPAMKEQDWTTSADNVTRVNFNVFEGERGMAEDNNLIGSCKLSGIISAPAFVPKLKVVFNLDVDGILSISAKDLSSGNESTITITNDNGRLTDHDINRMIADADLYKLEDEERRRKAQARCEFEKFAYETRNIIRLSENISKLQKSDKDLMERSCAEAIKWVEQNAATASEEDCCEQKKQLEEIWNPIKLQLDL